MSARQAQSGLCCVVHAQFTWLHYFVFSRNDGHMLSMFLQATQFGMFRELALAASKDIDPSAMSYVLSTMLNFQPTPAHALILSNVGLPPKLTKFLSCSHSGKFRD